VLPIVALLAFTLSGDPGPGPTRLVQAATFRSGRPVLGAATVPDPSAGLPVGGAGGDLARVDTDLDTAGLSSGSPTSPAVGGDAAGAVATSSTTASGAHSGTHGRPTYGSPPPRVTGQHSPDRPRPAGSRTPHPVRTVTVTVTPSTSTSATSTTTTSASTTTNPATTEAPPSSSSQSSSEQPSSSESSSSESSSEPEAGVTEPLPVPQPAPPPPLPTVGLVPPPAAGTGGADFHGWTSGASGAGVADGSFGAWRGSPVAIAGTWDDGDAASQTQLPTLTGEYASWSGDLDVAVGGTVLHTGESYAEAARGAYVQRWTAMAANLQALRGSRPGLTYVRPFHEFNGNWYPNWFVTPANVADYRTAFRLFASTLRAGCPRCKVVWSAGNSSSGGAAPIADAYPGDDVVDVVGIDSYDANGNTIVTDGAAWTRYAEATRGADPVGPEAWRRFALSHGKPLCFPEWGLNHGSGGGDDAAYIQGMHDWMTEHAARPGDPDVSGKVVYDVYFNIAMGGDSGFLIKGGPNVAAGRLYTSLSWGTSLAATVATGATVTSAASLAGSAGTSSVLGASTVTTTATWNGAP